MESKVEMLHLVSFIFALQNINLLVSALIYAVAFLKYLIWYFRVLLTHEIEQ